MPDDIIEAINETLATGVASWDPAYAGVTLSPPTLARHRQSFLLRYDIPGAAPGTRPLLVKIPRRSNMTEIAEAVAAERLHPLGRQEFDALQAVSAAVTDAGDDQLFAVRPIAYLDPWNAIVMEELDFRSLKEVVERPVTGLGRSSDWTEIERFYEQAARWLRLYHQQIGHPQQVLLEQTPTATEFDAAIDRLERATGGKVDVGWLRAASAGAYARCHRLPVEIALIHGDFHSGNIIVDSAGRVGSLDIDARARELPVERDLTTLLIEVETSLPQTLSHGLFVRSRWRRRCQQAALRGYFGDLPHEPALIELFSALAITQRWMAREEDANHRTGWKRHASRPAIWLMRHYLARVLRRHLTPAAT